MKTPFAIVAACVLACAQLPAAAGFELVNNDRVLWVGSTFAERAQYYGYDETRLTLRWPNRNFVFRNLGWSGDTVWADARAGFDTAKEGFNRLRELVKSLKPTVIFVAYGANEAYAGSAGLEQFEAGLKSMLDMLAGSKVRLVLVSPIRLEDVGRPLPDPAPQNARLEEYVALLEGVARERHAAWIDLFHHLPMGQGCRLTENGLHLSAVGYYRCSQAIESALELPPLDWRVSLDWGDAPQVVESVGTEVEMQVQRNDLAEFRVSDEVLPAPPPPEGSPCPALATPTRTLTIDGLPVGRYRLSIDDREVIVADAATWAAGVELTSGPEFMAVERLRAAIREKNELFFNRWRPQNETYLFGFRKHEQGQNAKEVAEFDALVAAQEAQIAALRRPAPHVYRLTREVKK
ncbi:MAG: SGNH/GDSL hydrolase family protein [Pirellulales bacterium]|nr:SGNH/GDSL hydrolase family protein [Pirellulales bacterium]